MKLSVSYNFFNGEELLYYAVKHMRPMVDHISIVCQEISNTGNKISQNAREALKKIESENLVDDLILYNPDFSLTPYQNEHNKRKLGYECAKAHNATHFLCSDADEFFKFDEFQNAKEYILNHEINYSACHSYFYIKQPFYRSKKIDATNVCFICAIDENTIFELNEPTPFPNIDSTRSMFNKVDRKIFFREDQITMHHMNFVRKDFTSKFNNTSSRKNPHLQNFLKELEQSIVSWKFGQVFHFPQKESYEIIETDNYFDLPMMEPGISSISNLTSEDKREDKQNIRDKFDVPKPSSRLKHDQDRKLNILLTNHHLLDFTGSEVFTFTVADFLKKNGHNVIVYSKYIDRIRNYFNTRNIPVIDDLNSVKGMHFDVAHVHHNINALEVRYFFPTLPIIFLSHGVLPFLEQPPLIDINISKFLAVSEEVKNNLISKVDESYSVEVYHNIVDTTIFQPISPINEKPRNALVISSRIDQSTEDIIRKACSRLNIGCEFIGLRFRDIDYFLVAQYINRADIVFSLGRGAIEAMMCARVPIVYDYLGGDGLITLANFSDIMKCNFSGRVHKIDFTVESLMEEILKYRPEYGEKLRKIACQYFGDETQGPKLVEIYNIVMDDIISPLPQQTQSHIEYILSSVNESRSYMENLLYRKYNKAPTNVISRDSSSKSNLHEQAIQLFNKKIVYGAIEAMHRAIASDPWNAEYYNDLGAMYYASGDIAKAQEYFEKALEINPQDITSLKNLIELFINKGQFEDARDMCSRLKSLAPDDEEVNNLYSIIYDKVTFENSADCNNKALDVTMGTANITKELKNNDKQLWSLPESAPLHNSIFYKSLLIEQPKFHNDGQGNPISWNTNDRLLNFLDAYLQPRMHTLETGSGYSTVLFIGKKCVHTAVTPAQIEFNRISNYCKEHNLPLDHVRFIVRDSADHLPLLNENNLDVLFIDGAHRFPFPIIDWFYGSKLLKQGGITIVDDTDIISCFILRGFLAQDDHWETVLIEKDFSVFRKLAGHDYPGDWPGQIFSKKKIQDAETFLKVFFDTPAHRSASRNKALKTPDTRLHHPPSATPNIPLHGPETIMKTTPVVPHDAEKPDVGTTKDIAVDWTPAFDYQTLTVEEIKEYSNIEVTEDLREGGIHAQKAWEYWFKYLSKNIWKTSLSAEIVSFCNTIDHPRILSLGCGYGGVELGIARQLNKPFQITAVDLNGQLFTRARQEAKANGFDIRFMDLDLNYVKIHENSFDLIFAHASLHHLLNLEHVFLQTHRGLRENGRLIVQDIIGKTQVLFWKDNVDRAMEIVRQMPARYKAGIPDKQAIIAPYVEPATQKGMEGIRQEEIPALLESFFTPVKVFSYGAFMRLICTHSELGKRLDPDKPLDRKYLERIFKIDLQLIAQDKLRPTEMLGVYEKGTKVDIHKIQAQAQLRLGKLLVQQGKGDRVFEQFKRTALLTRDDQEKQYLYGSVPNLIDKKTNEDHESEVQIPPERDFLTDDLSKIEDPEAAVDNNNIKLSRRERSPCMLSIVLPVKNNLQGTTLNIQSVLENINQQNVELIVVDNGSNNCTRNYLSSLKHNKIKVILPEREKSCAQGGILGAENASGSFLMFLSDSVIITKLFLHTIMKTIESTSEWDAVVGKTVSKGQIILEAGATTIGEAGLESRGEGIQFLDPAYNFTCRVASGSRYAMLIRRDVWDKVNAFNPDMEDIGTALIDLGMKMISMGYRVLYQPQFIFIANNLASLQPVDAGAISPDLDILTSLRPKDLSPDIMTTLSKTSPKNVLVLGIYLANTLNTVSDIISVFNESKTHRVVQKWVALNGSPPDAKTAAATVKTIFGRVPKFQIINEILYGEDLSRYDYIILCDDDVVLPEYFVDSFIAMQSLLGFAIAQPARTIKSYIDHPIVEQHIGVHARQTYFVEIGPVISFHRSACDFIFPFDLTSPMGWGYENVWAYEALQRNLKMGIIDGVCVDHSIRKPVANYEWDQADKERSAYLNKYNHLPLEECFRMVNAHIISEESI